MKKVLLIIIFTSLALNIYALSPIKTITVNKTITKQEVIIDNITINPNAKHIVIRLIKKELDKDGNVIRILNDKVINISDTDYDMVIKAIGINFDKLIFAIKNKYEEKPKQEEGENKK